jgi:inhibitor of cysteine peptidase
LKPFNRVDLGDIPLLESIHSNRSKEPRGNEQEWTDVYLQEPLERRVSGMKTPSNELPRLVLAVLILTGLMTACASDDAFTLSMADQGRSITLETGQELVLRLPSNPTTGYRWEIETLDRVYLQPIGEAEFVQDEQGGEQLVGVGGVEIFRFRALEPGMMDLKLIYHRTWETEPPLETFEINIDIQ